MAARASGGDIDEAPEEKRKCPCFVFSGLYDTALLEDMVA
jgi:hypothetical protein